MFKARLFLFFGAISIICSAASAASAQALKRGSPAKQKVFRQASNGTSIARPSSVIENRHSFSIGLDPLVLFNSSFGGQADVRVGDRFAVVVGGVYQPTQGRESSGTVKYHYTSSLYEVYLGSTIRLTGDFDRDGFYLLPAVGYIEASIQDFSDMKLSSSMGAPTGRLTAGYDWIWPASHLRFTLGGGYRALQSTDVVVKDRTGLEVYRENTSSLGGMVLDFRLSYLF